MKSIKMDSLYRGGGAHIFYAEFTASLRGNVYRLAATLRRLYGNSTETPRKSLYGMQFYGCFPAARRKLFGDGSALYGDSRKKRAESWESLWQHHGDSTTGSLGKHCNHPSAIYGIYNRFDVPFQSNFLMPPSDQICLVTTAEPCPPRTT